MTVLETVEDVEIDPATGEPRASHIVLPTKGKTAVQIVMEARINGTMVEALCGHRFVPERDPKQYPLCSKCKEIRAQARPDQDPEGIPHS